MLSTIATVSHALTATTTTTIAKSVAKGVGALPNASHLLIPIVVLGGGFLLIIGVVTMPKTDRVSAKLGGKVVGIVGRMGSGKTYMAVMIAYNHLAAGHQVRTNFTMVLPESCKDKWAYFTGWEQFAELENCVVVIDEAQLYAPSYKPIAFPLIARWKLAMARKFKLDVYWVSQHEDRVNSTLKHLTNIIYVCNAWFGSKYFSAKGYEPEYVRRAKKHIARRGYRFKLENAKLYDTLEVITPDAHLGDEKKVKEMAANHFAMIEDTGRNYNDRRKYGDCMATTKNGSPCRNGAASDAGFCTMHEKKGQTVDEVLEAARVAGLDVDEPKPRPPKYVEPPKVSFTLASGDPCVGLTDGGIRCGRATTNANHLCDDCIARAKESLKALRAPADSDTVSTQ